MVMMIIVLLFHFRKELVSDSRLVVMVIEWIWTQTKRNDFHIGWKSISLILQVLVQCCKPCRIWYQAYMGLFLYSCKYLFWDTMTNQFTPLQLKTPGLSHCCLFQWKPRLQSYLKTACEGHHVLVWCKSTQRSSYSYCSKKYEKIDQLIFSNINFLITTSWSCVV